MLGDDPFDPSGLTALVIDENHYQRGISLEQLRAMGFGRVIGCANTIEAWEALKSANPNVVLLDWVEGLSDGLDFVRRVRTSDEAPNRAVSMFMLTARGSQTDVETARRAGVDGYLRKPISALALQSRVKRVIANPQPFVVTATYVGPCRRRKRADAGYKGPFRRLDDVVAAQAQDADEQALKTELARARVAALELRARDLKPGDAASARDVFKAVQDLVAVGEQIGDPIVCFGAKEMARYLQAQGATERLEPEVVRTHVAALHQLVHLPHALGDERQRVANGLKRMVDKKLRQAGAA